MLRALALACCLIPAATAAQNMGTTPLLLQVGGDYLNDDLRKVLKTDWGYHAGLATLLSESGIMGVPSLDIDVRYAPDGEGTLLSFEAGYAERTLVGSQYWLGAGFTSNFVRLKLDPPGDGNDESDRRWAIGGKIMLGYLLTDRVFFEATYHYVGEALGIDASSVSASLGYWF